jgi:hypothetical protein
MPRLCYKSLDGLELWTSTELTHRTAPEELLRVMSKPLSYTVTPHCTESIEPSRVRRYRFDGFDSDSFNLIYREIWE